jgi:hypothetical protein
MRRAFLLFAALLYARGAWAQGNPLGPEFCVNRYTTGQQFGRSVAADPSGNFVVVWNSEGQYGTAFHVFAQRYASSGVPLGSEFRVNTYMPYGQGLGDVATDPSGNFVVVWISQSQDGSERGVFGQRYASSGTPLGPEFRVNTYTTDAQSGPSLAVDASGNFVVVWHSFGQDGSNWGVFGQRYASSGAPLGPEFRVSTYTTSAQDSAHVAADSAGNFVVVWVSYRQDDSASWGVFGQRYASSGAPLGAEFRVNTFTTNSQSSPSVAADSAGNFVVVWASYLQDGSYTGVFGQRYASSGALLGPEFRVNTHWTDFQDTPAVAADSSGNFVVVWESAWQDGSGFGVFGQRYKNSGAPLGPEFRVNSYTTYSQIDSLVAADSTGSFVVVWSSNGQDASWSVFGQRYSQIVPVELMHFRVE